MKSKSRAPAQPSTAGQPVDSTTASRPGASTSAAGVITAPRARNHGRRTVRRQPVATELTTPPHEAPQAEGEVNDDSVPPEPSQSAVSGNDNGKSPLYKFIHFYIGLNTDYITAEIDFEAIYGHVDHSLNPAFYDLTIDGRTLGGEVNEMFSNVENVYADFIPDGTIEWDVLTVMHYAEAKKDDVLHLHAWLTQAHIIRNAYYA